MGNFAFSTNALQPLPWTLYPQRTKFLWILLVCSGALALMIWSGRVHTLKWQLCLLLCGLAIPVSLLNLLPGCASLTITEEGLIVRVLFYDRKLIPWYQISNFGLIDNGHGELVGYSLHRDYQHELSMPTLSKWSTGFQANLPDTYGYTAPALIEMLRRYHTQFNTCENDL